MSNSTESRQLSFYQRIKICFLSVLRPTWNPAYIIFVIFCPREKLDHHHHITHTNFPVTLQKCKDDRGDKPSRMYVDMYQSVSRKNKRSSVNYYWTNLKITGKIFTTNNKTWKADRQYAVHHHLCSATRSGVGRIARRLYSFQLIPFRFFQFFHPFPEKMDFTATSSTHISPTINPYNIRYWQLKQEWVTARREKQWFLKRSPSPQMSGWLGLRTIIWTWTFWKIPE